MVVYLFLGILAIFFLGYAWGRVVQARVFAGKMVLEDVLKILLKAGRSGERMTAGMIAEELGRSESEIANVLQLTLSLDSLVQGNYNDKTWTLTPAGEKKALAILRAHRIYEQYLAEKTGYHPEEWHELAEKAEHALDEKKVDELAAALGTPLFDPHGDPIPEKDGTLVYSKRMLLSEAPLKTFFTVTHVEDEPIETYKNLTDQGIAPGSTLCVENVAGDILLVTVDGVQTVLPIADCKNIALAPQAVTVAKKTPPLRLSSLQIGEQGKVVSIATTCAGPQRRRLFDLGFVKGANVEASFVSPSGSPTAYTIRNTLIALQPEQTSAIFIEKIV